MTTLINKRDNFALSVNAIIIAIIICGRYVATPCKTTCMRNCAGTGFQISVSDKPKKVLNYSCSKAGYQQEFRRKKIRTEQDLNLRGQSPLDFESNALTTRPSVLDTHSV